MLMGLRNFLAKHKLGSVIVLAIVAIPGILIVVGRSNKPAQAAPPPLEVEVVKVEQKNVPIYSEWVGTTDGMVNADIKAQVTGYLLRQDYKEGSFVKKGQLLFEIDPRPFQAALDQANGQVAQFQGQLEQASSQVDAEQAGVEAARAQMAHAKAQISTAKAGVATAEGQLENANAAVKTAMLNLGFTKIISPIDGIAGMAQAQVGDLMSNTSNALTTVSTLDPIKVYFTLSEQEYLNYTKPFLSEAEQNGSLNQLELELVLADGTTYPQKGTFYFADRQVDPRTGAIRMAGIFPNPGNSLRPGQYGRVRAITRIKQNALMVPQRAVSELQGTYQVAVVGADSKVTFTGRKVTLLSAPTT